MSQQPPQPREQPAERPAYLTVSEAAQLARCSEKTIRRAFAAGRLRAFRPAGRVLLREDELRAWVERRAAAPAHREPPNRARARRTQPGSVASLRALERELTR